MKSSQKKAAAQPIAKKHTSPFVTNGYRNALDRLGRAFTESRPLALLIGEDDAGASFIIRSFLDGIEGEVAVAHMTEPCEDAVGGMRKIVDALGFDSNNMGLADLEDVVGMFLSLQKLHDRRTIVCVEATQDNGRWIFDEVRRLIELELEGQFGLLVILSGHPVLNELLNELPLSAVSAHVKSRITLAPFTVAETREYIQWRMESGGDAYVGPVFEADAIALMHELSGGVPDTVRNVCNKCLQFAEREKTSSVTAKIVVDAIKLSGVTQATGSRVVHAASPEVDGLCRAQNRLIVRMNGRLVEEKSLDPGEFLIGRDRLCDIHLADVAVSRRHAKVVISSDGVTLSDLGSRNGTFVNGREIEKYDLQDNDTIKIGRCTLKYVAGDNGLAWPARLETPK